MPAYYVTLDRTKSGQTLFHGADAAVVFAASGAAALQRVAAQYPSDGDTWLTDGTATEIVADADFNGWTFRVTVHGGTGGGGTDPFTAEFVGDATDNTIDEIAAQLVTLLNGATGIANAAYNATSNVLTAAGAADNLGDQKLSAEIIPPGAESGVASLVGTIVDEGSAGADLTVALPADAAVIPELLAVVKQVQ
jgi:hypothetical protein